MAKGKHMWWSEPAAAKCSNESEIFASTTIEKQWIFSHHCNAHVVRDPLKRIVTRNLHGAVQFLHLDNWRKKWFTIACALLKKKIILQQKFPGVKLVLKFLK